MMILYNKNGEPINSSDYKWMDEGKCANIYQKKSEILKIYKADCAYKYYLSKKMFHYLQDREIPNIVKLYDYYFTSNDCFRQLSFMSAYSMEKVQRDGTNLLLQSNDYLFSVAEELQVTLDYLNDYRIIIDDAHLFNIIFNQEGPHIIDIDQYRHSRLISKTDLKAHNLSRMLYYITSTLKKELENLGITPEQYFFSLYSINHSNANSIVEALSSHITEDTIIKSLYRKHH